MDPTDEDFNYDKQYRTMCTGLGSFLSSAQQGGDLEKNNGEGDNGTPGTSQYNALELSQRKQQHISKYSMSVAIKCNI